MKKGFQILFITFLLINLNTTSHAFIGGTIKAIKGVNLMIKNKVFAPLFKVGAADTGLMAVDNVATEVLSVRKINKNLIAKIKSSEEEELINLVKNDENTSISQYKNIDNASLESDEINWWWYLSPRWRHLGRDFKPDNFIYACETNSGDVYYFSLLPKKNLALVSSSVEMVISQRLKIESSSAEGTVLSGFTSNEEIRFFLLPNYKFYVGNNGEEKNLKIIPNGECYNTEINFDEKKINFVQYKIPVLDKNKSFIEKNLKYYQYIIYLFLGSMLAKLIYDSYIGKSKKRANEFVYVTYSLNVFALISFNLFGAGAALIILDGVSLVNWAKIVYWIIFIWYVYSIAVVIKSSYKSIKQSGFSLILNIDLILTTIIFLAGLTILLMTI
jgi:hypothetical protein